LIAKYGNWKNEAYTCNRCKWSGTGTELNEGEVHREAYEMCCPQCHQWLVINAHPVLLARSDSWELLDKTRSFKESKERRNESDEPEKSRQTRNLESEDLSGMNNKASGTFRSKFSEWFRRWVALRLKHHTKNIYLPANTRSMFNKR